MRFVFLAAFGALAACGSAETPEPEPSEVSTADWTVTPEVLPPGEAEFQMAWAEQCNAQEADIGSAVCKAKSLGSDSFACDFAHGDDQYRRYSADLERDGTVWVLADPSAACGLVSPD